MPEYDMRCVDCDKTFTVSIPYNSEKERTCPFCSSKRLVNIISKNIWVKYTGNGFTKKVKSDEDNHDRNPFG